MGTDPHTPLPLPLPLPSPSTATATATVIAPSTPPRQHAPRSRSTQSLPTPPASPPRLPRRARPRTTPTPSARARSPVPSPIQMPALTLDDFGALVAATLDAPSQLDLTLRVPVPTLSTSTSTSMVAIPEDLSRHEAQRAPQRSRSRPPMPTLFRRPSPLKITIPLSLAPESTSTSTPTSRAPSPSPFPNPNPKLLPLPAPKPLTAEPLLTPLPVAPMFSTFSLPRASPAASSSMHTTSPLQSIGSPSPMSSPFDFDNEAEFIRPPRAPPLSPPSRSSHEHSLIGVKRSESMPGHHTGLTNHHQLMGPPPVPTIPRRASGQSASTTRSNFSHRLKNLPFSTSMTKLAGRGSIQPSVQRSPKSSASSTTAPSSSIASPLLEIPEPVFSTISRSPSPAPTYANGPVSSTSTTSPRRGSKFSGFFALGRSGANTPTAPGTRASSPAPPPRRSTSVPALRNLVRLASKGYEAERDQPEDYINPAEISRVLTPDEDPFAKREVDILEISPKSKASSRKRKDDEKERDLPVFSNPFASSSPGLLGPSTSALGLYDPVDPFCTAPPTPVVPPSAWTHQSDDMPTPLAVVPAIHGIPPTPEPNVIQSTVEGRAWPKFGKARQLFGTNPSPPSPQRRGSAPLLLNVGGGLGVKQASPRRGSLRPSMSVEPSEGVVVVRGRTGTMGSSNSQSQSQGQGQGKKGLRERLGSAFKLGLGGVGGGGKTREKSPAPSHASSFWSRDAHEPLPASASSNENQDDQESLVVFPLKEPAFVTPIPSPPRLSSASSTVLPVPPPLITAPLVPRRKSTLELPLAHDDLVKSRYGASICPLGDKSGSTLTLPATEMDPTAQLIQLVLRSQSPVGTPDFLTPASSRPPSRAGLLPRKDELSPVEHESFMQRERKMSFPIAAGVGPRQRSLGELDLMFPARSSSVLALGCEARSDGQESDVESWRKGERERWECATDDGERSMLDLSIATGITTDHDEEIDTEGDSSLVGNATADALKGLGLELNAVVPELVNPWRNAGEWLGDNMDVSTIASSEGTEDSYSVSGSWPMPPPQSVGVGANGLRGSRSHFLARENRGLSPVKQVKSIPTMRRAVSFDPVHPPSLAKPHSAVLHHAHHPSMTGSFGDRAQNRMSTATGTSAYFSVRSRPSRPSTAASTWSFADALKMSPKRHESGSVEGVGRDKPLPPAPEDTSVVEEEEQDDSGVFVGDISTSASL